MDAMRFAALQQSLVGQATADNTMRRMLVDSIEDGMVVLKDLASSDLYDEPYPRFAGVALEQDDEVLVAELPGIGPGSGATRVIVCKLQRSAPETLAMDAPLIGQSYHMAGDFGASAQTPSSADATNYVPALTVAWTDLPNGSYRMVYQGDLLAAHSAGGEVDLRVMAGTTPSGAVDPIVPTTVPAQLRIAVAGVISTVVVSGGSGISLQVQYRPGTPGTAYVRNPTLRVTATRKA